MTEPSPTQFVPPEEPNRPDTEAGLQPATAQAVSTGGTQTSGMAVAAMVMGICGLVICPLILSIPAIVFGALAMKEVDREPGLDGKGMAIAGLVTGIVGTTLTLLLIILLIAIGVSADNETSGNHRHWKPAPGQEYNLD